MFNKEIFNKFLEEKNNILPNIVFDFNDNTKKYIEFLEKIIIERWKNK